MIIFGPVPSRRLGRSLGINNVPAKTCSYSCVYCQLGPTQATSLAPQPFYEPAAIQREVAARLAVAAARGERIDYLAFVPDGEPTLDAGLGQTIDLLRPLGVPIAVISNSSLIWQAEVRAVLMRADWVSLKLDAVEEGLWRRVNRPHAALAFPAVLAGIAQFAAEFTGQLATETMLLADLNTNDEALTQLADFLGKVQPATAYLSIPIRPPAEPWVRPPSEEAVNRAYQIVSRTVARVECLTEYEGNAFASSGDAEIDLLSIAAVHPLREDAVRALLETSGASWAIVRKLLDEERLKEMAYQGKKFYIRSFREGQ